MVLDQDKLQHGKHFSCAENATTRHAYAVLQLA